MKHFLLFLIPVIYAGAPADWACKSLDQQGSYDEDCIASKSYAAGVHTITSGTQGANQNRICVATLTADGLSDSKNFYLKATFNQNPGSRFFFGGVSYNMNDPKHGNYILMRIGSPVKGNMELGYIDGGMKTNQDVYEFNPARNFPVTVEVLVKDGDETIWVNGVLDSRGSAIEPHFSVNGKVGIGIQHIPIAQTAKVSGASICTPVQCTKDDGSIIQGGDTFVDVDGIQECTCTKDGIICKCPTPTIICPGGTTLWTDPEICESKCIRSPAYCSSTGDPHYRTFDHRYYDFHGVCSYQAATCGDFTVYFKNVDLHHRPPRYTKRIELEFKGDTFMIGNGYLVAVNPDPNHIATNVVMPYYKAYNDGSKVEIINNGQYEIRLYSKGRVPAVRLRATNYGAWINAEMWLHGSCADITEGLCGNWNSNPGDDLFGGTPNSNGQHYEQYDENCPEPPKPFDPCTDLGLDMTDQAYEKCKILEENPFSKCNAVVPTGGKDGPGILKNCMSDVCNCFVDESCACSQLETYATSCINRGIDLSNWAADVEFCPMDCPAGMTYKPNGASPPATCGKPAGTDTVRGCFCPDDKVFQDGKCIDSSECKCLYEGIIYNNGDTIKKEVECQVCTCQDGGSMTCDEMQCPAIECKDNEIESKLDDKCCLVCDDSWVKALNPDNTAEQGQKVVLTCEINAEGVRKKDITWYKDGKKITDGVSKNKLLLTLDDVDGDDSGTYTCEATKDGKTGSDDFNVDVKVPEQCEHEDGHKWDVGTKYSPTPTTECLCEAGGEFECGCKDDGEECPAETPVTWFDDECVKTCVPEPGICQAATDPHYTSFDGKRFDFKGDCVYHVFQCGDIGITADHEKDRASTHTKALEFAYKGDTYRLEKDTLRLNGDEVTVPFHKEFKDGATLYIENVGDYKLRLVENGMDPLVAVTWDKQSTYSIEAHGTCKGKTKGMCGNWNDDEGDDFKGKDGEIKDTAEEFGASWGLDDEEDCKIEPPPPSVCETMGQKDQEEALKDYVSSIFTVGVMKECFEKIGDETIVQNAVDDICFCFGDKTCGCPRLRNFATECKDEAGIDTDGWELTNQKSECAPECPEGSTFVKKGPKPAPTCANPEGGKKKQPGCFCPEGQVLEEDKCIDVDECKCEYAGELYKPGDKYDKPDSCETCTCAGGGAEDKCTEIKCNTKCKKGEIEVEVEGECCPECQGDWLTAVNPDAEGKLGEPLALTCEVADGVDVKDVKWIKFNPGEKDVTNIKKKYTVSDDGLTLTIKKMAEDMTGNYKCVAETNDGTKAEAEFEVSSPVEHEELIDPDEKDVDIAPGEDITLKVDKLGGVITAIYWECNGERITSKTPGYKIINKNKYNSLTILDADAADAGKCVCVAEGVGTDDEAVFNLNAEEVEELNLIDPAETDVTYTTGGPLTISVNKVKANDKKIEDVSLECNGKKVEGKNVEFKEGKKFYSFVIDPADNSYDGKCVVTASGAGVKDDSVEINVTAEEVEELEISVKPKKDNVECKAKKKGCKLPFTVSAKKGDKDVKILAKSVKVCKLVNGEPTSCKKAGCKYPNFCGKLKPAAGDAGDAGEYVAVVEVDGVKEISDPITLTVV